MFNTALEKTLNQAFQVARDKRHEFITVEHLLLSLLDNNDANLALAACRANFERLRSGLNIYIEENTPFIGDATEHNTQPTLGFQRVLQRAVFQVQSTGKAEVTGANVIVAIFGEPDSQAVYFLSQESITRTDITNFIAYGTSRISGESGPELSSGSLAEENTTFIGDEPAKESMLEQFTVNLNQLAMQGKVDPLIGRSEELERAVQVLCRRQKNNPLLVGEAGVGKTAIAEGLAKLIVEKKVPDAIAGSTIYALDLGVLLAGTKYRGDFEKRFKGILDELRMVEGSVVFIDEIHGLIGAGAAAGGSIDAANLIKPLLTGKGIRCMGATTYQEYRAIFEKDHALARRFQKIDIAEPSEEETLQIIKGLQSKLEKHHDVSYTLPALKSAVELSKRYLTDRFFPDKAIDVIDEAGAYQQLHAKKKEEEVVKVTRKEVEAVVARMAQIPSETISVSDKEQLKNLDRNLKMMIFGQDPAIDALTSAIRLSRSGLREPEKPVGSFLFAGPTGVGKTEVTKQLASLLGVELIRFDMSEYREPHTISRLLGSPPGYVGYEQGGLLTEEVNKHPYAVLLLDELEKAHPDVYNVLLQIMDHGTVTDNNGRHADFRHIILVMTTNQGADQLERSSMGFSEQNHQTDTQQAIKELFTPEFRNRLDAVVQFQPLGTDMIVHVVDKLLMELQAQLAVKNVTLKVEPEVKTWLAEHGYDKYMGARPMARLIQEKIKQPLAEALLFGSLKKGHTITVRCDNSELLVES